MSRCQECHDNAIAGSFFQFLKRQRIRRRLHTTYDAARQDVFEYSKMLHNPKRKHTKNGFLPPLSFEKRWKKLNEVGA
jgi:putative transposase